MARLSTVEAEIINHSSGNGFNKNDHSLSITRCNKDFFTNLMSNNALRTTYL